ncbi:hypothetical protein BH10BAC5_BH10BAC5_15140 [soil metagenome]
MKSLTQITLFLFIFSLTTVVIFFLFLGLVTAANKECAAMNIANNSEMHHTTFSDANHIKYTAEYKVSFISLSPLKIHVSASIPINGRTLDMDQTYPADLPEMSLKGWPALVSNLIVSDAMGNRIEIKDDVKKGWQLPDSTQSLLKLSYDLDYSIFASSEWSSALESAFADSNNAIVVGRSVFITTSQINEINVKIITPKGWNAITPWKKISKQKYKIMSEEDLINNILVFSKIKPDVFTASGFKIQIVTMGHWQPLRPLVSRVLKTIIKREVELMNFKEKETYDVVLLPISDEGGNAFRQSFVYCYNDPSPENKDVWGNTLAHEIFHYWNYARLKGDSYSKSQWFQEGFTEYVANHVMVTGKIIDSNMFLNKLSEHVNNYRKLTTSLENYGTHKGPPLYSAGALVAFMWDIKIREVSNGNRNIGDFFRNLMTQTESGKRKYTWIDIKAALQNTADYDWEGFYQSYIKGQEQLPLDSFFSIIGLSLNKSTDGSEEVFYSTIQSVESKNLFHNLIWN